MLESVGQSVVEASLDAAGVPFATLRVGEHSEVVVTEYGGRILGPFFDGDAGGAFWLNTEAFRSKDAFRNFVDTKQWNLGGERVWVSPEIRYHVRDRSDFWGSLDLPDAIDPGEHHLQHLKVGEGSNRPAPGAKLEQTVTVRDHLSGEVLRDLRIDREVRAAPNPLSQFAGSGGSGDVDVGAGGLQYAGYRHSVRFELPERSRAVCEPWTLFQVRPGGWAIVSAVGDQSYRDYFEPVQTSRVRRSDSCLSFRVDGTQRFKVGIKAANVLGRIGYFEEFGDGNGQLIVRSFHNDPSSRYLEEPPHMEGEGGQSVHIVDDGGTFAGFGELECNGRSVGAKTGRCETTDEFLLWCFRGSVESLRGPARRLLGWSPGEDR